jgi:hypothetical protein
VKASAELETIFEKDNPHKSLLQVTTANSGEAQLQRAEPMAIGSRSTPDSNAILKVQERLRLERD